MIHAQGLDWFMCSVIRITDAFLKKFLHKSPVFPEDAPSQKHPAIDRPEDESVVQVPENVPRIQKLSTDDPKLSFGKQGLNVIKCDNVWFPHI